MKKKRCTRCGKRRILTRFNMDRTTKDGHAFECKLCATERTKRWKRKGSSKERTEKLRKLRLSRQLCRKRNRTFVFNYLKTHPCVDCGETDPIVLEFDHVRGKKVLDVGKMMNNSYSLKNLQEEIAKCDVRCANCHRRKTSIGQSWYKDLLV
jgi:hypothetical protein